MNNYIQSVCDITVIIYNKVARITRLSLLMCRKIHNNYIQNSSQNLIPGKGFQKFLHKYWRSCCSTLQYINCKWIKVLDGGHYLTDCSLSESGHVCLETGCLPADNLRNQLAMESGHWEVGGVACSTCGWTVKKKKACLKKVLIWVLFCLLILVIDL